MAKTVENSVDVVEVFPDKAANTIILRDGLESPSRGLIARSGSFDACVVDKGFSDLRYLWLEDEGDIAVEDGDRVGMTLGEDGTPFCAEGRLEGGEITRGDVEGAVVVSNKQIEHRVTRASGHTFNELVDKGRDGGVANGDGIEGL